MAKTIDKMRKQDTPPVVKSQARTEQENSPKSKVASAVEYLNKFYPGWDTYLKVKNN
jgi:hypothetical protein